MSEQREARKKARTWAREKIMHELECEFDDYKRMLRHYAPYGQQPFRGLSVRNLTMSLDQIVQRPAEWDDLFDHQRKAMVRDILEGIHGIGKRWHKPKNKREQVLYYLH